MRSVLRRILAVTAIVVLGTSTVNGATTNADGQAPMRSITVAIAEGTQEAFFEQLRGYSQEYQFAILIAPDLPGGVSFAVQMYRRDIEILGGTNPFVANEFYLGVYLYGDRRPVPEDIVDMLIDGLVNFIDQVPGATITVSMPVYQRPAAKGAARPGHETIPPAVASRPVGSSGRL